MGIVHCYSINHTFLILQKICLAIIRQERQNCSFAMEALESDLIISEESFESSFWLGLIYVEIWSRVLCS